MEFLNLTPHKIVIETQNGKKKRVEIPPSGCVARLDVKQKIVGKINGIPIVKTEYGDIILSDNVDITDKVLIVSSLVAQKAFKLIEKGAKAVMAPDTGPSAIRNKEGQIEAVTRLVLLAE